MPDVLVQVKVHKGLRDSIERMQRELLKAKKNEQGWILAPDATPLFHRDPSIGDIIEQAVFEWKKKYGL